MNLAELTLGVLVGAYLGNLLAVELKIKERGE